MKEKKRHGGLIFLLILLALIGFGVYKLYPAYKVIRECTSFTDAVFTAEYDVVRQSADIPLLSQLQDKIDHGTIKGRIADGIIRGEAYLKGSQKASMEFIRTNRQSYFNLSYLGANAIRDLNILDLDAIAKWADGLSGYYMTGDQIKTLLKETIGAVVGVRTEMLVDTSSYTLPDYTLPLSYIKSHLIGMLPCMNPPMDAVSRGISDDMFFFQRLSRETGDPEFIIGVPKKLNDEREVYFFYDYGEQSIAMTVRYTPQEKAETIEVPSDNAIVGDKLVNALKLILDVLSLH